jgi:hypothetical protein
MINDRYEAMMFAKSAEEARRNARELVRLVLGEDAVSQSLADSLRECCRELRPSDDPREQARFENEFIELGIWPTPAQHRVAA